MKKIIVVLLLSISSVVYPQANLIQSIDFDSQGRVIFALTGSYDFSYAVRYDNQNFEYWNLTQLFGTQFYHISTSTDPSDNILAFMQNKLYKYDGLSWSEIEIPSPPLSYQKYSDLSFYNGQLWLSTYTDGIINNSKIWRYDNSQSQWTIFKTDNTDLPEYASFGKFFHKNDTTWVGTNKGLLYIVNDVIYVINKNTSPNLPSDLIYTFFIDSEHNRWIGTMDSGLVKWDGGLGFQTFNSSNSDLPNNFINGIDADSEGRIWLATDIGIASIYNNVVSAYPNLQLGSIAEIKVDAADNVWIGEVGKGALYKFRNSELTLITNISEDVYLQPEKFLLDQNYPNPFNPSTTIKYSTLTDGIVSLKVFDVLGREVEVLVDEFKPAGKHQVNFSPDNLSGGVYFYSLQMNGVMLTRKMLLLK